MNTEKMNAEKTDLRVVKTHKTIRNALIELLETVPFEKIAVQDILDLALVNRSTFYKYYSGKSDLAGKMIADFKADYQKLILERQTTTDLDATLATASEAMFAWRKTILALWKVQTKRHHLYQDMFLMIKKNYLLHAEKTGNKGNLDYQSTILATVALTTCKYYFEQNLPVPVTKAWADWEQMLATVRSV